MPNAPPACNNAKRNVAAACDGLTEDDYASEFSAGTPPKQRQSHWKHCENLAVLKGML
jgi:hypothetical protein